MRRRRSFEVWRPEMSIFLHFEGQDGFGDHPTPGWIELWSLNGGQDGLCGLSPWVGGPLRRLRRLHTSCTRSVSVLRPGPRAPLCFLVFVFSPSLTALEAPGRPLNERSKTLRPVLRRGVRTNVDRWDPGGPGVGTWPLSSGPSRHTHSDLFWGNPARTACVRGRWDPCVQ